jgi:hypothetical protein
MNDGKPLNLPESRLRWTALPYGSQLCRSALHPDETVLAGGTDLQNYLHMLRPDQTGFRGTVLGER